MHKNAIKILGWVKISAIYGWKLVFSPFFWTFWSVFFVLFWSDIRDFQEKSTGNTDSCWWLNWIWIVDVEWFLNFFSEKFLNWFDFKESWSFFLDDITQVLMKVFKSQYSILEDHLEIQFGKFWMEDLRNFDAEARILWKRVNAHSLILFS